MTQWTTAHQAHLSMGFFRQEYYSGLPFPSPGHLPNPGIEPVYLKFPALAGHSLPLGLPGKLDTGKDRRQKEKRAAEDEMVGQHH